MLHLQPTITEFQNTTSAGNYPDRVEDYFLDVASNQCESKLS